jgi:hypothetical protein
MNNFNYIKNQPTYALKNMVRALSSFGLLNTEEENERLKATKIELRNRRK